MELIASVQEVAEPGLPARPFLTLGVALLFAVIYLLGGRASQVLGAPGLRRFHSFAAGLAVSYVFVHVLPQLHAIREVHRLSQADYLKRLFPEHSVYLSALLGFLVFYGLENLVVRPRRGGATGGDHHGSAAPWQPWVHIGGFALYSWLITFQLQHQGMSLLALGLFALAMGMHLAPIANRLRGDYPAVYGRRGAAVLALASLAGWACGLALDLPGPLVLDLAAIVAGGVIVNAAIAELPKEREASYGFFVIGAIFYTALLLALSHYEKP